MRWLFKLVKYLIEIKRRSKIAPLPRMAAAEYTSIDSDAARIMTRYGIRSPSGVALAMRRYGVSTVDDLITHLEHHRAKRSIHLRLLQGIARLSGGTRLNPHTQEIRKITPKNNQDKILRERIRRIKA